MRAHRPGHNRTCLWLRLRSPSLRPARGSLSTATRAVNENFNAVVVEDAIFTCTSIKEEALAVLRHAYAKMVTAEELVSHWAKGA